MNPLPKLTATFRPQVWRHDHTIDIDDEVQFDATPAILLLTAAAIRDFRHNNYDSDYLADDLPAMKEHCGPFEVDVDLDEWLDENGVEDRYIITDEQWESVKKKYGLG